MIESTRLRRHDIDLDPVEMDYLLLTKLVGHVDISTFTAKTGVGNNADAWCAVVADILTGDTQVEVELCERTPQVAVAHTVRIDRSIVAVDGSAPLLRTTEFIACLRDDIDDATYSITAVLNCSPARPNHFEALSCAQRDLR